LSNKIFTYFFVLEILNKSTNREGCKNMRGKCECAIYLFV